MARNTQLGMPAATAANRLRKIVLFRLAQRLGEDVCWRCNQPIASVEEFALEHRDHNWNVEIASYWDPENVCFAHVSCTHRTKDTGCTNSP